MCPSHRDIHFKEECKVKFFQVKLKVSTLDDVHVYPPSVKFLAISLAKRRHVTGFRKKKKSLQLGETSALNVLF